MPGFPARPPLRQSSGRASGGFAVQISSRLIGLALVVMLVLLQYRLWFGDGSLREVRHLQQRLGTMTQEAQKLRERNQALEAEVVDLKEGLDAVEERARQDLGMIKPDEVFIQIVEKEEAKPPPAAQSVPRKNQEKGKLQKPPASPKPRPSPPTPLVDD
jgi:cell division protein FtsB